MGSPVRRMIDRLLTVVARTALRGFFRRLEVDGTETLPKGRPVLVVANHFNGFIDPVMLVHVFGRLPRFLARSTLWDMKFARPLLAFAGMIPVYRPQDVEDLSGNVSVFEACYRVLAKGGLVGIFPEGITHDEPSIKDVRTGAARIALGAHAAGVEGLLIVPVGLLFDDKVALRSRVLGRVGRAIEVDDFARDRSHGGAVVDDSDHDAVRELTTTIDHRLREVAPDYVDQREARVLRRAAEVALRTGEDRPAHVTLASQERLARELARTPQSVRDEIADELARYHLDLELAGLRDRQVEAGLHARALLQRTIVTTVALTVLAPFAFVGALWNALPYWLVKLVGRVVAEPVTKGTARLVAALVLFPLSWASVVWFDDYSGVLPGLLVVIIAPVLGLIAVGWFEALVRVTADWRGWIGITDRRALLPGVEVARARVVDVVVVAAGPVAMADALQRS